MRAEAITEEPDAEELRLREQVDGLRALLCEVTGLTLSGVAHLETLFRRAQDRNAGVERLPVMTPEAEVVYKLLSPFWVTTGVLVDMAIPSGLTHRVRKVRRAALMSRLKWLETEGLAEKRLVTLDDDKTTLEWRRARSE